MEPSIEGIETWYAVRVRSTAIYPREPRRTAHRFTEQIAGTCIRTCMDTVYRWGLRLSLWGGGRTQVKRYGVVMSMSLTDPITKCDRELVGRGEKVKASCFFGCVVCTPYLHQLSRPN
jgi:hypothetical protein